MRGVLIVAGDPSGDVYAARLAEALARRGARGLAGVGGPALRAALSGRGEFIEDLVSLGLSGFLEPLRKIPALWRLRRRLAGHLAGERPEAVVCVDFYGFNRHVLPLAKAAGAKAYYFVSPQVWASRPGRVRVLKRWVDRMLVIFPFEEALYRAAGVPVAWVGHPLLDILPEPASPPEGPPLRLGLLPGSRPSEVRRHLPVFLGALERVARDFPSLDAPLFASANLPDAFYADLLARWDSPLKGRVRLVRESGYAERRALHLALTCSGTATLENALLGLPMVVVYKMSWPTYAIARTLIRVRHVAMANILAGRRLVPELIQGEARPERVAQAALELLARPERLDALRRELGALRRSLGGPGAVERAADILCARGLPSPA